MKFTWGNKILVAILAFVTMMGTLVYKCLHTNYELVSNEYYKDELNYQNVIEATNRTTALQGIASIAVKDDALQLALPDEMKNKSIKGSILFYCPSDESKDRKMDLKVGPDAGQRIEKTTLRPGHYTVKITWEADGQSYYSEQYLSL